MKITIHTPQAIWQLGKRKNQEDALYPTPGTATADDRLFIVCDGMGGHEKGEVASAAVCRGMSQALDDVLVENELLSDFCFDDAIEQAYDALDSADTGHEGRMGTTMTCLCLHKGGCLAAHIGDSRIYHIRPRKRQILYRSRDHSLVQHLYELGEISYNDMATSPRRNIITRVMQPYQQVRTKPTVVYITDLQPDDYLLLLSDGMLEQMDDAELLDILCSKGTDEEKAAFLQEATQQNADNHSAYIIRIKNVKHERSDRHLPSTEKKEREQNKALNDTRRDLAWSLYTDTLDTQRLADEATAADGRQQKKQPTFLKWLRSLAKP